MTGFIEGIKANYVLLLVLIALAGLIVDVVFHIIHVKKGHKIPDAEKLAKKQAKKQLRAQYRAAKKALCVPNEVVKEDKKDEKKK